MKQIIAFLILNITSFASAQNHELIGYWQNWNDSNAPYIPLNLVDSRYTILCVSFAVPTSPSDMTMMFIPDGVSQAALISQIQALQNQGKKIILSIGGATTSISLSDTTSKNAFINSMNTLLETYPFDGIDIDIEHGNSILASGTIENPTSPDCNNLIDAITQIKAHYFTIYNRTMMLTSRPISTFRAPPQSASLACRLLGNDGETLQQMRAKGMDQRHIRRIPPVSHHHPANPGDVVAGVKRVPGPVQINLHPGGIIHRPGDWHADIGDIAVHIAGRNVHAAGKCNRQMGKVAANPGTLLPTLKGGAGGPGIHIVKGDVVVHIVANRLHPRPTARSIAEHVPGNLAQPVGVAIPAGQQVQDGVIGQFGQRRLGQPRKDRVRQTLAADHAVTADRKAAHRRHKPSAHIAETVAVQPRRHPWRGHNLALGKDIIAPLVAHRQHRDHRCILRASDGDVVPNSHQHIRPLYTTGQSQHQPCP